MHRVLALGFAVGLASCSCNYAVLDHDQALTVGVPIGIRIEAKTELIGMLVANIDDPNKKFLEVTPLPGFAGRYVLKRVPVPQGTAFEVVGFRKPSNILCYGRMDAVLRPSKPIEPSGAEVHINLDSAADGRFVVDQEMFVEQKPRVNGRVEGVNP